MHTYVQYYVYIYIYKRTGRYLRSLDIRMYNNNNNNNETEWKKKEKTISVI